MIIIIFVTMAWSQFHWPLIPSPVYLSCFPNPLASLSRASIVLLLLYDAESCISSSTICLAFSHLLFLRRVWEGPVCAVWAVRAGCRSAGVTDAWLEEITEDLLVQSSARAGLSELFSKRHLHEELVCTSPGSLLQRLASGAVRKHFSVFDPIPLSSKRNGVVFLWLQLLSLS